MNKQSNPPVYRPQPVYLPDDAGIERGFMTPLGESEPLVPEHASDRARYDHKTIFYDVFFSADGKDLLCIGPPLLNFGMPLAITCGKQVLKFTVETTFYSVYLNFSLVRIKAADCPQMKAPSFNLHFRFADFEVAVSCSPQKVMPLAKKALTLATLQKDNEVQWLEDWCVWHSKAHNVERIIIYDNGSANFEEVYAKLSALDVELVFVHWPYPYGSVRSGPAKWFNAYCQVGSLNHCRLFFGGSTEWCINLDVDEYLYCCGGWSLASSLNKPRLIPPAVVFLDSYFVPTMEKDDDHEIPRCFHFSLRNSKPRGGSGRKYIYRPDSVAVNHAHGILISKKGRLFFDLLKRALRKVLTALPEALKLPRHFMAAEANVDEIFFYHFVGLNTGWKHGKWMPQVGRGEKLVADDRIAKMAALIKSVEA